MVSNFFASASHLVLLLALLAPTIAAAEDALQRQRTVEAGREQFTRVRQHATKSLTATENVDRFFNARSCAECHKLGGLGGAGANEHNVQLVSPRVPVNLSGNAPLPSERAALDQRVRPLPSRPSSIDPDEHEREAALARFTPIGTSESRILHRRSSLPGYDVWRRSLLPELAPVKLAFVRPPSTTRPVAIRRELTLGERAMGIKEAFEIPEVSPQTRNVSGATGGKRENRWLQVEERNTPALFGLGLIDSIPQAELDRIAAAQPAEIRGISPQLRTGGRGRFGWKAQNATLADFNEGACAAELGLRTEKFAPSEWVAFRKRSASERDATPPQVAAVDMTREDIKVLTIYIAALPEPKQVIDHGKDYDVGQGEFLFRTTGCATCHVPDIGGVIGIYSDLLLHDSGTPSATAYYGGPIGPPPANFDIVRDVHIRTPPLWGVADSAPYLHDGSAATLEEAIFGHQGQAYKAAQNFRLKLSDQEQQQILTFLRSLRAPQVVAKND